MKPALIIAAIALVGIGAVTLVPSPQSQSTESAQTASASLQQGTVVYDVRTPEEYATSRVASATLLPLADIEAGALPEVDKDAPIAVYCRSGNRSAQAASILERAGFTNVTDMGGLSDVTRYGLVAERPTTCETDDC